MTSKFPIRLTVVVLLAAGALHACGGSDSNNNGGFAAQCTDAGICTAADGGKYYQGSGGSAGGTSYPCNHNNIVEPPEQCDGTNLGAMGTCQAATMGVQPIGQVSCDTNCRYVLYLCSSANGGGNTGAGGGFGTGGGFGAGGGG